MNRIILYITIILTLITSSFIHANLLTLNNTCTLSGSIHQESIKEVIKCLSNEKVKNLVVYSSGGEVEAGKKFAKILESNNKLNIIVVKAHSMAAFMLGSASGKVYVVDSSEVLIHRPFTLITTNYMDIFLASELLIELEKIQEELITIFVKNTKLSKDLVRFNLMRNRKNIYINFNNKYGIKVGLFDKIITFRCSKWFKFTYKHICERGESK